MQLLQCTVITDVNVCVHGVAVAVSITELARMANTSAATVSRALSGKPGVSKERRANIRLLAESVGYKPNQLARNLLAKHTNTLGFVTANLTNGTHIQLLQALETGARDRDYEMLVADSRRCVERERANIEALQRNRVDGLIILPVWELDRDVDQHHLLDLQARGVPFVVASDMEEYGFPTVANDERLAGRETAEYLLSLGHRNLAVVGCDDAKQLNRARLAGIRDAVDERGDAATMKELGFEFGTDAARATIEELFQAPGRPTALIALFSHLALRLLRPLHQLGIRIPDDVSMVVFDDSDWCPWSVPAMTAVASRNRHLASAILEELARRIESPNLAPVHKRIPQRIIHRESVRPIANNQ